MGQVIPIEDAYEDVIFEKEENDKHPGSKEV